MAVYATGCPISVDIFSPQPVPCSTSPNGFLRKTITSTRYNCFNDDYAPGARARWDLLSLWYSGYSFETPVTDTPPIPIAFPAPGIYIDVPRPNKRDVEERQSVCQCDPKAAVGCPDDCVNRYICANPAGFYQTGFQYHHTINKMYRKYLVFQLGLGICQMLSFKHQFAQIPQTLQWMPISICFEREVPMYHIHSLFNGYSVRNTAMAIVSRCMLNPGTSKKRMSADIVLLQKKCKCSN
jgi:hypothetical protein